MVTLMEYAKIADKVYEPSSCQEPAIAGFTCPHGYAVDDQSVFAGGSFWTSGLQARLFTRRNGDDAVIAFKGTKPSMVSDLTADLRIIGYGMPRQAVDALKLVSEWKGRLAGRRVSLVGHSLGGAIAQVVGAITDVRFVTFNAPGMWSNAVGVCSFPKLLNTTKLGMNYIKWGDVVGNFGKHIGDTTRVRSTGHSIVGFIEFLKTYGDRNRDPLA
jgi:hypothetical protein